MKRFNISALLGSCLSGMLFVAFALVGCQNKQELVFGESDNGRALDLLENFEKTLLANPNGWQMTYEVPKASIGGTFTIQLQFSENKTVKMWADYLEAPTTSSYALSLYNGPMISFDSPGALTLLADPSIQPTPDIKKGDGYWGENDFTIVSVSAEKIVLRGLKYNKVVELLPLKEPANLSNGGIASSLRTLAKQLTMFGNSVVLMNGTEKLNAISFVVPKLGALISSTSELPQFKMVLPPMKEGAEPKEYVITYSADGFTTAPALEVGGKAYSSFVFNEASKRFTAKDNEEVFINLQALSALTMNLLHEGGKYYGKMLYMVEVSNAFNADILSKIPDLIPNFLAIQLYNRLPNVSGWSFFAYNKAENKKDWYDFQGQLELLDDEKGLYTFKAAGRGHKDIIAQLNKEGDNAVKDFFKFFSTLMYRDAFVKIEEVAPNQIKVTSFAKLVPQINKDYWITFQLAE